MNKVKIAVSIVLIVISGVLIVRWLNPAPLDARSLPSSGLGQVVAEETIRVLAGKGEVVVVYLPVESVESRAKIKGFTRTIEASDGVRVSSTEILKPEDVQSMGRLTFEHFLRIVRNHSDADAIVMFRGVTPFHAGKVKKLADPLPKLIVAGWNPRHIHAGFDAGVIHAGISAREFRTLPTDDPKTPLEWFDRYYEVSTFDASDGP
jgi:hypothetical protein